MSDLKGVTEDGKKGSLKRTDLSERIDSALRSRYARPQWLRGSTTKTAEEDPVIEEKAVMNNHEIASVIESYATDLCIDYYGHDLRRHEFQNLLQEHLLDLACKFREIK